MSDREGRMGAVVGGVFLIGLGLVFLFRDQLQVDWGVIWPFFLIVPGAFIFVRSLTIGEPGQKTGGLIGGAILVFLGAVFLAENYLDLDWQKIWPFFLIIPGVAILLGASRGRSRRHDAPAPPMTPMAPPPAEGWQVDPGTPQGPVTPPVGGTGPTGPEGPGTPGAPSA
jgi:hypothetical protein